MAKRKSLTFKKYEGSSSSTSKPEVRSGGEDQPASVNDRLHELRQARPSEAAERRRVLAESANQASVPPDVQSILGVRGTNQPLASRLRTRVRDRIRTPGPAPPSSWLQGDVSGTVSPSSGPSGKKSFDRDQERPQISLHRFKKLYSGISYPGGLTGAALAKLASCWHDLDPTDKELLTILPQSVRRDLFSYLAHYQQTLTAAEFHILTKEASSIPELDLGGLIARADLSLSVVSSLLKQAHGAHEDEYVAETWEVESLPSFTIQHASSIHALTHLGLSHPPKTILWRDLLTLSKHTPSLTHLSLAFWPQPTLTPNLTTAYVTNRTGHTVDAGGSSFYSEVDMDREEATVIFRKLSSNLLSLQFLDIEGNYNWLPAFASVGPASPSDLLTGNWRGLTRIYCDPIPSQHATDFCQWQDISPMSLLSFDRLSRQQFALSVKVQSMGNQVALRGSYQSWELTIQAMRCIASSRHEAGAQRLKFDMATFPG